MKTFIWALAAVAILATFTFFSYVSKNDKEVTMREQIVTQQSVCGANFDKMFKTISGIAQVSTQYMTQSKEAFKEIYTPLIEGRYQDKNGNQEQVLMKWIQESNPQFDMAAAKDLYIKVQQAVETCRNEFFNEQKKLLAYHQAHSTFCKTFINANLFGMKSKSIPLCSGVVEEGDDFCVQIITSRNTKDAYRTGEENDISIY